MGGFLESVMDGRTNGGELTGLSASGWGPKKANLDQKGPELDRARFFRSRKHQFSKRRP